MPYISKVGARRSALKGGKGVAQNAGELNFQLTSLVRENRYAESKLPDFIQARIRRYLDRLQLLRTNARLGYADYNEVLGVLDAADREHRRRGWWRGTEGEPSVFEYAARAFYAGVVAPYEELKIIENGDL